jgi:hypothetical protein
LLVLTFENVGARGVLSGQFAKRFFGPIVIDMRSVRPALFCLISQIRAAFRHLSQPLVEADLKENT